jgi:hypothetical protein
MPCAGEIEMGRMRNRITNRDYKSWLDCLADVNTHSSRTPSLLGLKIGCNIGVCFCLYCFLFSALPRNNVLAY